MVGPVILATVVALTALIIVLAVLSAADASVRLLSRTRTRRLVDAEVPGAVALDRLCERPSRLAAALAFWRALGFALGTSAVAYAAFVMVEELTLPVTLAVAAIGMVAMFSIGEALPRAVAVQNPERVGLATAAWASGLTTAFAPVARLFAAGWVAAAGLIAEDPVRDAWLTGDEYVLDGPDDEEAGREEAEEAFFEAVVDFSSTIVREVMVPRTDMECLEDTATVEEAIALISRRVCRACRSITRRSTTSSACCTPRTCSPAPTEKRVRRRSPRLRGKRSSCPRRNRLTSSWWRCANARRTWRSWPTSTAVPPGW